jgi:hypothetical protein
VINLNPLWVGLLGIGLGQTLPALAEQPSTIAPPAAAVSLPMAQQVAQPLRDRPIAAPHILMAQAVAVPTQPSQELAAQSLTQWVERNGCGSPTVLQSRPQPTNRYEMAALLASCLDALGDRALNSQEQSTIKTLRSEFKIELAALQDSQSDLIRLRQSIDSNPGTSTSSSPSIRWVRGLDQDSMIRRQEKVVQGSSSLGIKAEANLGKIGVFGRYSVAAGTPLSLPEGGAALTRGDLDLTSGLKDRSFQNWSAGIGIRGFIIPKSVLTLSAGRTFANPLGQLDSNNYGAFYQFPIGDRLTLSPSVVIISNPTNPSNPDIQGAVQASFSF